MTQKFRYRQIPSQPQPHPQQSKADRATWWLSSVLIRVSDLECSISFYKDVLGLREMFHQSGAALLCDDRNEGPWLDLRQVDGLGVRVGPQGVGLRACSFCVGSDTALDRVEERLKALSAFEGRQQRGEDGRIGLVRGRDPDRLPLAFWNYERPMTLAQRQAAFSTIYGWDS